MECLCGCGLHPKLGKKFIRFHHLKLVKPLFGPDNPMFGKKQSEASNNLRRIKLKGIKKDPRKGISIDKFYGHEKATEIRKKLCGRTPWNKGIPSHLAPNWRGGSSFKQYGGGFTNKLKLIIRSKFCGCCALCGDSYRVQIHHIDYDKKNNSELNLILLCIRCHMRTNGKRDKWPGILKSLRVLGSFNFENIVGCDARTRAIEMELLPNG